METSINENKCNLKQINQISNLSNIPTGRNCFEITFKLMGNINVSYEIIIAVVFKLPFIMDIWGIMKEGHTPLSMLMDYTYQNWFSGKKPSKVFFSSQISTSPICS